MPPGTFADRLPRFDSASSDFSMYAEQTVLGRGNAGPPHGPWQTAIGRRISELNMTAMDKLQTTVDNLDKVAKGQKAEILKIMSENYPGVSEPDATSRTTNIAMHTWKAPEGLTSSPPKPAHNC